MIVWQCLGLPPKVAEILTSILQGTEYLLKTGHGLAKRTYITYILNKTLGIGQGSGGGPSIWTSILDTILWPVSEKYNSFILETHTKQIITHLGDTYVDDTPQITISHPKYHPQNFNNTQESISSLITKGLQTLLNKTELIDAHKPSSQRQQTQELPDQK